MLRKTLLLVAILVGAAAAWLAWGLNSRPSLGPWAGTPVPPASAPGGLRVTFLGVSTLLLRGDSGAVLVDGFFTRPGLVATALLPLAPDHRRIDAALARAGIERLDAVVTVHSHYDHAMDAPAVAARTGAVVVGSTSTANIARGQGLAEDRIRIVSGSETMRFGDLTLTLLPSRHFPHGQAMGEISAPLVPPARATRWLEGGSFSVLVEKDGRAVLVQGSAGWEDGALEGRRAEVVYLGIGLLGSKEEDYREAYWREVVRTVGARRVVPIHWDDFTRGLDQPLVPLPRLLDDLEASMRFVSRKCAEEGIDLRWPVLWQEGDPFAGLVP